MVFVGDGADLGKLNFFESILECEAAGDVGVWIAPVLGQKSHAEVDAVGFS